MAQLEISSLTKTYPGGVTAVCDANFSIRDGEFIVLVGPSGCGKSTILRMIAGLETITGGEVKIDGTRVNEQEPGERDIAMVFQNYALYPHMSIFDNMGFSLKLRKRPKTEIEEKVLEAAEILNLKPYLERSPGQLSGGQRQRVAMGRALVRDAQVFLFDEPLSNLDAKLRVVMRTEIKALHQRLKTTSVYVTHDQIEAMTMADRIVVMNAGRVEQVGAPLELYDSPANLFVAGFLGSPSMNFIKGRYQREKDGARVVCEDGTALPVSPVSSAWHDEPVVLGIRPEHLRLAGEGEGVAATVDVVEPTGANIEVFVDLAGERVCAVFSERHPFRPGETVALGWDLDKVHLFDSDTGKRI